MSKFTEGPWQFYEPEEWGNGIYTRSLENNKGEAVLSGGDYEIETTKENAVLISAAPDMYHALECALAVLQEDSPDEAATEIVRKALEKAGNTPEGENK